MSTNPSPQPPTDLTQLLLNAIGYSTDADTTQAIITDFQSPTGESIASSDSARTTSITAPYDYDDGGYSRWGFAQYA